jgi:hypothetical protein
MRPRARRAARSSIDPSALAAAISETTAARSRE